MCVCVCVIYTEGSELSGVEVVMTMTHQDQRPVSDTSRVAGFSGKATTQPLTRLTY